MRADEAAALLTYDSDADLVTRSEALGPTSALIVLRHAEAIKRADWRESSAAKAQHDTARPLTTAGRSDADALAADLAAYGVTRVISSPSKRCRQTVGPSPASTT